MSLYLLGSLLILAGVVFLAVQVLGRGPLSNAKRAGPQIEPSLEPRRQGGIVNLKSNWPGYLLILVGTALLLIVPT